MDPLERFLEALDILGKEALDLIELEGINLKAAGEKIEQIDYGEMVDLYYNDPVGFAEDVHQTERTVFFYCAYQLT